MEKACENCRYTTFGEAYITTNRTTVTTGASIATNSTETKYEPVGSVKQKGVSIYVKR